MPYNRNNNNYGRVIPLHRATNEPVETVDFNAAIEFISMDECCARLMQLKIAHTRLTDFHLKIGPVNFYPTRGTVMLDGKPPLPQKGFDIFINCLRERRMIRDNKPAASLKARAADEIKLVADDGTSITACGPTD